MRAIVYVALLVLTARVRRAVQATIQVVLEEELERLVGAGPFERRRAEPRACARPTWRSSSSPHVCVVRCKATIQVVLEEELERLVGAGPYERSDQCIDVRNGHCPDAS